MLASIVSLLIVLIGVPTRFKYYWTGSKIKRRQSARDVSRKFYIVSWIVYVLQTIHCTIIGDWVNVIFWSVGLGTVGYAIVMCYRFWHEDLGLWAWLLDSFQSEEEGGLWL